MKQSMFRRFAAFMLVCMMLAAYCSTAPVLAQTEETYYITEIVNVDTTNGASVTPGAMFVWDSCTIDNEARTISFVMPSYNNPRVAAIVHSGGTTSLLTGVTETTEALQIGWSGRVLQYENAYLYDGQVLSIPSESGETSCDYTVHVTFPEVELAGSGTAAAPYLITSDEDFAYWYNKMTYTSWSDKTSAWSMPDVYIKQTVDVTYSGELCNYDSWTNNFSCHYDGDGHTITVEGQGTYNACLFGARIYGSVQNVTLAGTLTSTADCAAFGKPRNGCVIRNVHSTLTQNGTNTFIVSSSCDTDATVENCLHSGTLNGTGLRSTYWGYGKPVYTIASNLSENWVYYTDVRSTAATGELLATLNAYADENGLVRWGQVIGTDATPILGKVVPDPVENDLNGDYALNSRDAIHLLYHTMLPEQYALPAGTDCDYKRDGLVNTKDAIQLLYHTIMPEAYPLYQSLLSGLNLSILGDSLSSYDGYSNVGTTNTTLVADKDAGMEAFLSSVDETYWMQVAKRNEMNILVNNSWPGSLMRGSSGSAGAGTRAVNLHANTGALAGTTPDVVAVFMGTNDLFWSEPGTYSEDLYATLITENANGTYTYATPTNYVESYIIAMHKITTTYPDAKVFCFTLHPNKGCSDEVVQQFNAIIEAVAAHYGAPIVDLYNSELTATDTYLADSLHFNATGMKVVADLFEAVLMDAYRE